MGIDPHVAEQARAVLRRYFDALNARDPKAVRDTFNFPHFRISATGGVTHYPDASSDPYANFAGRVGKDGWDHSVMDSIEVLETFPKKAHVTIAFRRIRADGSEIGAYRSLYVVTEIDGHWGLQAGSGDGG